MKALWIGTGLMIAAIAAYLVADKPIVRTIERVSTDSSGTTHRRVTVNVIIGMGNTINYNYKDES